MSVVAWFLAWEWVNISLEYAVTAWVRLPRWFLSVVSVNLATHPVFVALIGRFGTSTGFVLPCEACIVGIEALLLMAIYGFCRWRLLLGVSLLMNLSSYATGLMIGG